MTRIYVFALILLLTYGVLAQPEVDGSWLVQFGATGSVVDIAVQRDNKMILVAPCFNINLGDRPFCAVRLFENGGVDSSFGNAPGAIGAYFNFGTQVSGVAIQNDGKVVAVGYLSGSNENVVLVRWNANGTADPTFGTSSNGTVMTDILPSTHDRGKKLLVQPDGKILVVGRSSSSMFVARYLENGTLDPSFGAGGVATASAGSTTIGQSIALQGDGKILAGGASTTAFVLARFNANGTPDNSWDSDGVATIGTANAGEGSGFRSIALQSDGKVLALGHSNILYRFNSDGTPDTGFDGDGFRQALNYSLSDPYGVRVSPGGTITVVGEKIFIFGQFDVFDYVTARYLANGSPDPSFSGDGFLDINIFANDGARSIAMDSLGQVVMGGRSTPGTVAFPFETPQLSGARLRSAGGSVGVSGRVTYSSGRGANGATVTVTGGGGVRTTLTNGFGYYSISNVAPGQVYAVTAKAKRHSFNTRNVFVGENVAGADVSEE